MDAVILNTTEDPWQELLLPVSPDGNAFTARLSLRRLPAAGKWFLSLSDASTGEQLVNQIPLICSYGYINDLFRSFRHLYRGRGIGSLTVIRAVDKPSTEDPGRDNLNEFRIVWSDMLEP